MSEASATDERNNSQAPMSPRPHPVYNKETYTDTDLILISNDNVIFYVHASVLSLASTVFKDMFALPRIPDKDTGAPEPVQMSESAEALSILLDVVYPGRGIPDIPKIMLFSDVATAAHKFNMQGALQTLSKYSISLYTQHAEEYHPVALYTVAHRLQWEDARHFAASESLKYDLAAEMSDGRLHGALPCIDMTSLISLQAWHRKRRNILEEYVGTFKNPPILTQTSAPREPSCASDHSPDHDVAMKRFFNRMRVAMDERPDCAILLSKGFWDESASEFTCAKCRKAFRDMDKFRLVVEDMIKKLPQYPGDTKRSNYKMVRRR